MVDPQTVGIAVTAISVVIGIIYYIFTARTTLQTRQAQLFMQLYSIYESKEFLKDYTDLWRYERRNIDLSDS